MPITELTKKRPLISVAAALVALLFVLLALNTRASHDLTTANECHLSPYKPACYRLTDGAARSRPVGMTMHNTARLQMNETQSSAEFLSLLPSGGHTVSVPLDGPNGTGERVPHTVALFHQLRCLEVLREDYAERRRETPLGRHCLNYLRQSILCLADSKLEPAITPFFDQPHTVEFRTDYVCKDWTAVYDAAEKYR